MTFSTEIERFICEFSKEINDNNAAIFAGAGLSVGAGHVSWPELLEPIANELGLDVECERSLVDLAQYYVNEQQNRASINNLLFREFSKNAELTDNHRLLARLPISVYWTTNYDNLIEASLEKEGKQFAVKHHVKQLHLSKPGCDTVVYKMHGDFNHPADAVIIKDDYERYQQSRQPFLTALGSDIMSKTFLFLGFSFTDPNIDHILSRIRVTLENNVRQHYAIMIRKERNGGKKKTVSGDYEEQRQKHFINDLKRFGIKVLLIDDYEEVTKILERLDKLNRARSVLISGSASDFGEVRWDWKEAEKLVQWISNELIKNEYRIVSGFGLGIGSAVINGALKEIYSNQNMTVGDRLILRPFPQNRQDAEQKDQLYTQYRKDLVSLAGTAIFLFGNKRENGNSINAPGVEEEFDIAVRENINVIPVGATGYATRTLWKRVKDDLSKYFPNKENIREPFLRLGKEDADDDEIVTALFEILKLLKE